MGTQFNLSMIIISRCEGKREIRAVDVQAWMIIVDISLIKQPATAADEFPREITVFEL